MRAALSPGPQRQRELLLLLLVLAAAVGVRLIKITQPFVDKWSWRQADVAMIAENFYRHGFNILYPQINWAGSTPGYVGTEFPLVPFLAALLYPALGVHEWIGRAISVLFFTASVPFLYLLVRKVCSARAARLAAALYALAPLGIAASRVFMPDMASLCLAMAALYLFSEWLDRDGGRRLFIAMTIATTLALLVKLPAIVVAVPLAYLAWAKYGAGFLRQPALWAFAAAALLPAAAWYAHAYVISVSYFPHHFFGSGGLTVQSPHFYLGVFVRTLTSHLTPVLSLLALAGMCRPPRAPSGRLFHWWLVALVLFVLLAGWGHRHEWYQLPFVPVAAALAGIGLDGALTGLARLTRSRLAAASLVLAVFGAAGALSYRALQPIYLPWGVPLWEAGRAVDRIAPPGALVIVTDNGDPTVIYYSRRHGWHFLANGLFTRHPADGQEAIAALETLRAQGATHLVFTRYAFWWFEKYRDFAAYLDATYPRVSDRREFVIYDLTRARGENRQPAASQRPGPGAAQSAVPSAARTAAGSG